MESKIAHQKEEILRLSKQMEDEQNLTEEEKYAAMSEFTKQKMICKDFIENHANSVNDTLKSKFTSLEKARCSWYEDSLKWYYKQEPM